MTTKTIGPIELVRGLDALLKDRTIGTTFSEQFIHDGHLISFSIQRLPEVGNRLFGTPMPPKPNNWISITDDLPDPEVDVLVCCNAGSRYEAYEVAHRVYDDIDPEEIIDYWASSDCQLDEITHWMYIKGPCKDELE
jgi:hypothetical protein